MIIAFDISGELNGTTGICEFNNLQGFKCYDVKRNDYQENIGYLKALTNIIYKNQPEYIIVENYVNYQDRSDAFLYSENRTSELLGVLEYFCNLNKIEIIKIKAVQYKNLVDRNFLKLHNIETKGLSKHSVDALSMCIFQYFHNKKQLLTK